MAQALATAESHAQRLPGSDPLDALHALALEPFALMQRDPRCWPGCAPVPAERVGSAGR